MWYVGEMVSDAYVRMGTAASFILEVLAERQKRRTP